MPLNFKIYSSENIDDFISTWGARIQPLDIYYQPSFLACDAAMQKGTFEIATYTDGENYWLYPYIILPITNTPYFDLSSPYGYAGPITSSITFGKKVEVLFLEHIENRGDIVTEFIRYHFIYNQHYKFEQNIHNLLNRRIVVLNTNKSVDLWLEQCSSTNRNLVRKLEKEGYLWSEKQFELKDVTVFDDAYRKNMIHSKASDFYFFDTSFYESLITQLGDKIRIAYVIKDNIVYASALFFVSGETVTYYLSARNLDYPKVPASNLLLTKISFWAQDNGYSYFNLGGGLSLAEDDFLFKFKKNFGKDIYDFMIGKRIVQQALYEELKLNYISTYGKEKYEKVKHLLQFYR